MMMVTMYEFFFGLLSYYCIACSSSSSDVSKKIFERSMTFLNGLLDAPNAFGLGFLCYHVFRKKEKRKYLERTIKYVCCDALLYYYRFYNCLMYIIIHVCIFLSSLDEYISLSFSLPPFLTKDFIGYSGEVSISYPT